MMNVEEFRREDWMENLPLLTQPLLVLALEVACLEFNVDPNTLAALLRIEMEFVGSGHRVGLYEKFREVLNTALCARGESPILTSLDGGHDH